MRGRGSCLLIGATALLSACGPSPTSSTKASASGASPQAEAPELWSIDAQNDQGKVIKTILICADAAVRQSFLRPMPSPNGEPCELIAPTVQTGGRFAARCKSGGRLLDVQAESSGDQTRDFTVKLLIQSNVKGAEAFQQTLHYRRLEACPTGWSAGDAAAPGDQQTVNAVSGAVRQLPSPVQAPAS